MGDFKINEKTVFTQSGSAEPAMGSTITGIPAAGVTGVLPVGVTGGSGLDASNIGTTHASVWQLVSSFTGSATPLTTFERIDGDGNGYIGSDMAESSGIWTFPTTGIWHINFKHVANSNSGGAGYCITQIMATIDNSTYPEQGSYSVSYFSGASQYTSYNTNWIFDVTSTSLCKVKFVISQSNSSNKTSGTTTEFHSGATFIRLGDT